MNLSLPPAGIRARCATLSACNTAQGTGEDVEATGEAIEDLGEETEDEL